MIIDGFIFYNEIDILKIRLEELYEVVDRFIIVQADQTFRGEAKPFYLDRHADWLRPFLKKIYFVNLTMPRDLTDPWKREEWQRNNIGEFAQQIGGPDDLLIVSDADEIPRRETIKEIKIWNTSHVELWSPMYYYGLNVRQGDWAGIKVVRVNQLAEKTAEQIRHTKMPSYIRNGGWHFSYLGDAEFIKNKIKAFSHSELDRPDIHAGIADALANHRDLFGFADKPFEIEEVDETWPEAVKNNPNYWSKYIW